jgi:hypothetical protein
VIHIAAVTALFVQTSGKRLALDVLFPARVIAGTLTSPGLLMGHATSPPPIRKYKKYSVVFRQEEPCEGAFILLHGKVALSTGGSVGQALPIAYHGEGAILGLAETLSGVATKRPRSLPQTSPCNSFRAPML